MFNSRRKVFVSFDYDNDRHYKYLLGAWNANPNFEFVFEETTPGEIDTNNVGRIKAGLTTKINQSTHTLVIVGKEANKQHRLYREIGFRNWINFEIYQSIQHGNKIVAVKLSPYFELPEQLRFASRVSYVDGFDEKPIIWALNYG